MKKSDKLLSLCSNKFEALQLTGEKLKIYNEIKQNSEYRLTALSTTKERNAVKQLLKHGVIVKGELTSSYASFLKNWK